MTGISVILNGARVASSTDSLAQLLAEQRIDGAQRFIAVAVNNVLVPRSGWPDLRLSDGDRIEIVQPMKGG
jgi:sulfur carrier protein